jgi:hypothetical protein
MKNHRFLSHSGLESSRRNSATHKVNEGMESFDRRANVNHVSKTLTETVVRSVAKIRHGDNTVTYAITETLSKSLVVEEVAMNSADRTATKTITDTKLNMSRSWLEDPSAFFEAAK